MGRKKVKKSEIYMLGLAIRWRRDSQLFFCDFYSYESDKDMLTDWPVILLNHQMVIEAHNRQKGDSNWSPLQFFFFSSIYFCFGGMGMGMAVGVGVGVGVGRREERQKERKI